MAKDSQILLKPALVGGFDKKAVLSYIFDLNESTQDAHHKLLEQIEELTNTRDDLTEKLKDMESRLAYAQDELQDTKAQLSGYSDKSTEFSSLVDNLKNELSRQNQALAQKSEELANYTAINANLEKENKELSLKLQAFEEKRGMVEQAAAQINDLIGKARNDAAKIIEQAKGNASQITAAANAQADSVRESARMNAEKQMAEVKGRFDGVYKQFDGFCAEFTNLKQTIAGTTSTINEKMESLHQAIQKANGLAPEPAASISFSEDVPDAESDTIKKADDILTQFGIQKDNSGFFRLAAED